MRTTPKGVVVKGLTASQARQLLVSTECTTCRQTLIYISSQARPELIHWFVHPKCGHSKLCLVRAWCPACHTELFACRHCGHLPYEHTCTPAGPNADTATLPAVLPASKEVV